MKMASSSSGFRIVLTLNSAPTDQKLNPGKPSSLPNNQIIPEPDSKPEVRIRKLRGSSQLNRWSRSRGLQTRRRLDRPDHLTHTSNLISPVQKGMEDGSVISLQGEREMRIGSEDNGEMTEVKAIYMISDGTGWTAEHSVNAALGQFEHCLAAGACPVNTYLFSGVNDVDHLLEIIKQAAREGATLFYTLADPSMAESAKQACMLWDVPCTDILGPIIDTIATHLQTSPSSIPGSSPGRKLPLTEEYFRRIEAIEFTIKHDDGALPRNLHKADIVLAGVSRTGKTPLSIYLAQKGYKVANVPIVTGVELPKTLFDIDPEKVFGLTINPVVLQTIRRSRAKTLGFGDNVISSYSEMHHIRRELEFAGIIFSQNPVWPVIEVTGKAIEETAAVLLRLYRDRKQKCSIPRISRRY